MAGKGDAAPDMQNKCLLNCNSSTISSDWQFSLKNMTVSSMEKTSSNHLPICDSNIFEPFSCSRTTILDSSGPAIWDQLSGSQNSGFGEGNFHHGASMPDALGIRPVGLQLPRPGLDYISGLGLTPPDTMLKGDLFVQAAGGFCPPSLAHIPADSGCTERAAKYSCFSSGNFGDLVNPFSMPETAYAPPSGHMSVQVPLEHLAGRGLKLTSETPSQKNEKATEDMRRPLDEAKLSVTDPKIDSDEAEHSGRGDQHELGSVVGDVSSKGLTSNKRKRFSKDAELDRRLLGKSPGVMKDHTGLEEKEKQHPISTMDKPGEKGPGASDIHKEQYIHVRARRGQATNSHSLAERIRREKISERMKFLQDLVPGCSKVTGKAVMLDEIINYVQSLQRQVEFLSMKFATLNPQLESNLERLLTKEILQSRGAPSSSLTLPPSIVTRRPPLHQPQGLVQAGTQALGGSPDALRRAMNSSLTAMVGVHNEHLSHVSSVWEDELRNIVHMGLNSRVPSCSQDISGSLAPGHTKAEP